MSVKFKNEHIKNIVLTYSVEIPIEFECTDCGETVYAMIGSDRGEFKCSHCGKTYLPKDVGMRYSDKFDDITDSEGSEDGKLGSKCDYDISSGLNFFHNGGNHNVWVSGKATTMSIPDEYKGETQDDYIEGAKKAIREFVSEIGGEAVEEPRICNIQMNVPLKQNIRQRAAILALQADSSPFFNITYVPEEFPAAQIQHKKTGVSLQLFSSCVNMGGVSDMEKFEETYLDLIEVLDEYDVLDKEENLP